MVHIGPSVDQYTDHQLSGGTTDWGCFRPVTIGIRPVTVDFNRRRLLSGGNGRFQPSLTDFEGYQPREGEEKPRVRHYFRPHDPSDFFSPTRGEEMSPRVGRRNEATTAYRSVPHTARCCVSYHTKQSLVCRYKPV
ncbi:hypothetical protein B296_00047597 [Ensete ventricosum]|uniref:Uncharacterized protein n=1 Tax=Ensete ventricosum TaxID=4639 RepID=A0A426YYQ3_ENSVE|nr:hypothetical protein B296_00047597 [Ensete ventricosum]